MKSFKFIQYAIKDQPQLWRTSIGSIWPRMGVNYGWSWNRTIISCLVNETSISGMQTHFPPMSVIVLQIMWVSRLRDFKLIFTLICWPAQLFFEPYSVTEYGVINLSLLPMYFNSSVLMTNWQITKKLLSDFVSRGEEQEAEIE